MNSLIGSKNIEKDFRELLERYPELLKCVPILLAVRTSQIYAQDDEGAFNYDFNKKNYSTEQYITFMKKTGLMDLIANHLVNNLVDYALGVENMTDTIKAPQLYVEKRNTGDMDYNALAGVLTKALANVQMTSTLNVDGRTVAETNKPL